MTRLFALLAVLLLAFTAPALAAPVVGAAAPDFTALDIHGQNFKLSGHKGKIVVLEWTNHECPFVVKHYETGNMQKTQKAAMDQGVEWISIVSSAPGKQGHATPEEAQTILDEANAHPTAKILDDSGTIGNLYGAKTTPHMFVINKDGVLAYAGAIDDQPTPAHDTVEGAKNYVLAAIEDLNAGRAVQTPETASYGCGVKY
ncbi:MAG: redoxin domain-containing protein [Alphaproteobacteria bacterium]|nr:redoxin domain-containing protein [Alphaproteobacteria bacterium]